MSVVQTRGVFGSLAAERGGVVVCGVLPQGGIVRASSSSLCLGGPVPPWCSTDPASPTAALQKGLCWGVCRLYPGLRGCVRRGKRRREGLNPAACCENAWSGVKVIEKSEAWG